MDNTGTQEKDPSYEELLSKYKKDQEFKKFDTTHWSLLTGIVIFTIFQIFAELAIYYSHDFIKTASCDATSSALVMILLACGRVFISMYIIWHVIYVYIVTYRNEIEIWLKKHNFNMKAIA